MYHVYALFDDRDPEAVRYIGFSKNPVHRIRSHIAEARHSSKRSHRLHWMRSLLADGLSPRWRSLVLVESAGEAARIEIALIQKYRARGCELVNGTEGGEGVDGFGGNITVVRVQSPELKAKRSAIWKQPEVQAKLRAAARAREPWHRRPPGVPIPPEQREKISAALKGRPKTREHAMKAAAWCRGRPKSPEQRAKISATKTGNSPVSPEMRAQISAKMKGVPKSPETRERMREAQRKRFAKVETEAWP